jgi:acetyl esterase/lipase
VQITLTADRTSLQPGECAILQWRVEGGFGVELDGQPVERSGQQEVCPQDTAVYELGVDTGETIERREIVLSVAGSKASAATLVPSQATSTRQTAGEASLHRDLAYASYQLDGAEHKLLLDLYLPAQSASQSIPLLIFVHGGGWFEGSKDTCPGATFAQNGYAMACVNYRLADFDRGCPQELVFPAQIHDVKAAVRWLRQHADQYGLDPSRFGAMGDSSGGHLAALLGTSGGETDLQGTGNSGISDAVQAVCVWYGPVDVTRAPPTIVFKDDPCQTPLGRLEDTYGGEETPYFYWTLAWGAFLGGSLDDAAVIERARQATPLTYVDAADPPFLVIHGENDGMIPVEQSELLVAALNSAGVKVTLVRPAGVGHGYGAAGMEVMPALLTPTLQFFDTHLRGE